MREKLAEWLCSRCAKVCGSCSWTYDDEGIKDSYRTDADALIDFLRGNGWVKLAKDRPKVVCLCGSTRFTAEMLIVQWELTKQGNVVLSWCALPDSYYKGQEKAHIGDQEGVKALVDEVHKRKIDLADEVLVINIGGYYGDSTKSEIAYAREHGKSVRFLEGE